MWFFWSSIKEEKTPERQRDTLRNIPSTCLVQFRKEKVSVYVRPVCFLFCFYILQVYKTNLLSWLLRTLILFYRIECCLILELKMKPIKLVKLNRCGFVLWKCTHTQHTLKVCFWNRRPNDWRQHKYRSFSTTSLSLRCSGIPQAFGQCP
jgi:hypothetical protein